MQAKGAEGAAALPDSVYRLFFAQNILNFRVQTSDRILYFTFYRHQSS